MVPEVVQQGVVLSVWNAVTADAPTALQDVHDQGRIDGRAHALTPTTRVAAETTRLEIALSLTDFRTGLAWGAACDDAEGDQKPGTELAEIHAAQGINSSTDLLGVYFLVQGGALGSSTEVLRLPLSGCTSP